MALPPADRRTSRLCLVVTLALIAGAAIGCPLVALFLKFVEHLIDKI